MILVDHIELKIFTENAGLQSHTKSYAEKHDTSVLRKMKQEFKS